MPDVEPIDPRQHVWWHRLRRLGPFGFVIMVGAIAAPAVTVLLFGGVVIAYQYPWSTFVSGGSTIWLITAPIYVGACAWTWVYMEKRYRATLGVRCPGCGYMLRGVTGDRCPECGVETRGSAISHQPPGTV